MTAKKITQGLVLLLFIIPFTALLAGEIGGKSAVIFMIIVLALAGFVILFGKKIGAQNLYLYGNRITSN